MPTTIVNSGLADTDFTAILIYVRDVWCREAEAVPDRLDDDVRASLAHRDEAFTADDL